MVALNEGSFKNICSIPYCIVYFYGPSCPPCKKAALVLSEVEKKFSNVKIFKINVSESPNLAFRLGVQSTPTLLFMKNGKVDNQLVNVTFSSVTKQLSSY